MRVLATSASNLIFNNFCGHNHGFSHSSLQNRPPKWICSRNQYHSKQSRTNLRLGQPEHLVTTTSNTPRVVRCMSRAGSRCSSMDATTRISSRSSSRPSEWYPGITRWIIVVRDQKAAVSSPAITSRAIAASRFMPWQYPTAGLCNAKASRIRRSSSGMSPLYMCRLCNVAMEGSRQVHVDGLEGRCVHRAHSSDQFLVPPRGKLHLLLGSTQL